MNIYMMMLVAAGLLMISPVTAQADDHAVTPEAAVEHAAEVKEAMLKDGTKVSIEGDMVSVVAEDGTKTPAPDGEHELADGTKVTTKDGKIVPAEAPAVEAPAAPAAE